MYLSDGIAASGPIHAKHLETLAQNKCYTDVSYYFYGPLHGKTHALREPEESCPRDGLGPGLYPAFHEDFLSLPGLPTMF